MRENIIKFPSSRHILIPRLMTFDILVKIQELKRIFPNWSTFPDTFNANSSIMLKLICLDLENKNKIQISGLRGCISMTEIDRVFDFTLLFLTFC